MSDNEQGELQFLGLERLRQAVEAGHLLMDDEALALLDIAEAAQEVARIYYSERTTSMNRVRDKLAVLEQRGSND